MPEENAWDDFIHKDLVRKAIERGLVDSNLGRTKGVDEIRAKFGLDVEPQTNADTRR